MENTFPKTLGKIRNGKKMFKNAKENNALKSLKHPCVSYKN